MFNKAHNKRFIIISLFVLQ